jgi:hydroxyacylglutathione hydrolase
MYDSLSRLAALPDRTRVYCAHEYTLANLEFAARVEPENNDLQQRLAKTRRLRDEGRVTVPSTLEEEKRTNPFLRCDHPAVAAAAARFCDRVLEKPVEVFAAVRAWKDAS